MSLKAPGDNRKACYMRHSRTLFLMLFGLLVAACSSTGGSKAPQGDRNHIIRAELAELTATDAYEAVRQLRPHWLSTRGAATIRGFSSSDVMVHLDEALLGESETLQQISISIVEEMFYLSSSEASTRYGTGYLNGVIIVRTRR